MLTSVKHALRGLRKDPVFTAVAIGSLAIGIGATSAMFSLADAMLLRPLPVLQPDRVVALNTTPPLPFGNNTAISYPDYADLRDRNRTFEGLVAASFSKFGFSPDASAQPRMKFGLLSRAISSRSWASSRRLAAPFVPMKIRPRDAIPWWCSVTISGSASLAGIRPFSARRSGSMGWSFR
jgi:MacB-like periplasmic core domain